MNKENPTQLLIDLHYLPCIEYFVAILQADAIVLEANEFYEKQTYRNRCYILGANKVELLSIPVLDGNKKTFIREVKIDNDQLWQQIHWRTISAAYGKSPFFEFYADYFQAIFDKKHNFLWDFNLDMLTICLKLLKLNKTISLTESYEKNASTSNFDRRNALNPKNKDFQSVVTYQQNFGNEFVPNLSIMDLLFCKGNQAVEILKKYPTN